jgi:UrcA family protein
MSFIKSSQRAARFSVAFASLGCLLGGAPALADGSAYASRSVTVHYRDLDLSTAAGADWLYHRIEGAARFSCGDEGRSLREQSDWKSCYQRAIADAVAAVNSPALTAVYNREHPESAVTAMLRK